MVGKVGVGGKNPVRIQSMTTSDTRNAEATIDQIVKLADYGCEIARVTVQGKKEAESCEAIKNGLLKRGYDIPLVADIHFYPPAAMLVAEFVDKVRVNPGNYVDKRATFKIIEYNDKSYQEEIERIEEGFSPLVEKCKKRKISMRIGTNHGSLSDRIMNRYGDSPRGMVESALEFARVCRKYNYHDFIFSMKASNPVVMVEAYRLLVKEMMAIGWDYPLHLGVTEAGDGEDGRVKSAVGTGSLLLDGIGDTIRVSLTEDPWYEIDPCKRLVKLAENYPKKSCRPFFFEKRKVVSAPLHRDGSVFLKVTAKEFLQDDFFEKIGDTDGIFLDAITPNMEARVEKLKEMKKEVIAPHRMKHVAYIRDGDPTTWENDLSHDPAYVLLELTGNKLEAGRKFFEWIKAKGHQIPVILVAKYDLSPEDLVIHAAAEFGALLSDGMGEGICMVTNLELGFRKSLSFNILQAARMRASKTDFIACPGCGRTLFDLQSVTKSIREKTSHLPGVKIAIMGCIVNGPGEMADADFGYVGSRTNKIDLYVGKTCVEKGIDATEAVGKLVTLIKTHGRWVEPVV